jgi:hypothetical protein
MFAGGCSVGAGGDSGGSTRVYTDETFGYSLRYPVDWHLDTSKDVSRITVWETTVANFDAASGPSREVRRRSRGRLGVSIHLERDDRLAEFPRDGVALRIFHFEGGPFHDYDTEEAAFPLALDDFTLDEAPGSGPGFGSRSDARPTGLPRPLELSFGANGWAFSARAWIGPDASTPDRAQLERVVGSLRFPPLQEGSVVAFERFDVMGRAEEYPVPSATKILRADGFYLVHAPGGFYALRGGCQHDSGFVVVKFDRRTFEFSCPDGRRWNRIGAPLEPGDEPLRVLPAKVAHDGHVLVARGVYTYASRQLRARFWPR